MALARTRLLLVLAIVLATGLGVFLWRWFSAPVRPGPLTLEAAQFSDLPGWADTDAAQALAAFRRSCTKIDAKPANAPMGGAGYAGSAGDWQAVCAALPQAADPATAHAFFAAAFTPYAVSAGSVQDGLFTGYYEPALKASHTRHGPYQTPVYGLPTDLITVDLGKFRPEWAHEKIAGRLAAQTLVPYPDRAAIDAEGLKNAPVLFYAEDPIAVFFLHIQGSGRVSFDDGSTARVAYAAQNGQPYTAIGRTLIAEGAIPREKVSLQSIRAWLKAHPDQARRVMETNRSYVFFKETPLADPALGSAGSEGVPLTPKASLAIDLRLHPLGVPVYAAATAPDPDGAKPDRTFDHLLIAQDTGGAIRGAVRGDVFWGFGADAQAIAGRMKAHGSMFVLLPKAVAAKLGARKVFAETAP